MERLALGGGEVAMPRPAAGERQALESPTLPGAKAHRAHRPARGQTVERRSLGEPGPEAEPEALNGRCHVAREFLFAPMAQQLRDRDAHGAHGFAAATER